MNRSRLIAAGTSVGALVAITAGVAAANPAPSTTRATTTDRRVANTGIQRSTEDTPAFGSDDDGQDNWQQLPPDPSATDPGLGNSSTQTPTNQPSAHQPPAFDPRSGGSVGGGNNFGGSNTSSGGS